MDQNEIAVGKKANATLQRRGDRAVVNGVEVFGNRGSG